MKSERPTPESGGRLRGVLYYRVALSNVKCQFGDFNSAVGQVFPSGLLLRRSQHHP